MKTILKILFLSVVIVLTAFSCEKEEEALPPYHAKGRIIKTFGRCYGEWVMIEIENPKGIGLPGTFVAAPQYGDLEFDYNNAIGVPWFSKLPDIPENSPITIDTWLYFEYRVVEEEEKDLFRTIPPPICLANVIPPPVKYYIITKIIEFK